jgi:hypothetical protein
MADLSDLSDDDINKLVAIGEIPDKQALLGQQMKSALALRDRPLQMGTQGNRVFTAATPLGALGQVAGGIMANRQVGKLGQQQQGLLQQQSAGRKAYFDMIRKGLSSQPPPTDQLGLGDADPYSRNA